MAVGVIFGGWLFMLSKQAEQTLPREFDLDAYLNHWAGYWAGRLDGDDDVAASI